MAGCRYPCAVKIPRRVRGYAYQTFYRLPGVVRRRIVRLVVPKYLVGAVNIIRDSEAPDPGRLLLLRQPPGRAWGLPAGLLKKYEQPAIGAARELFEESGVRLDPRELTPANPNAIVHALGWVDMIFFGAVPASTTPLVVDGGEVLEARWFPVDQLPRLTPNTEQLLGVYGIGPAAAGMRTSEADPTGGNAAEHQAAAQTVTVQNAAAPGITVPDAASDGPAAAGTPDGDSGTEASADDRRG
jgi:8-oxo-dGTP pyrophosphatase MutT (NUDIX family)